MCNCQQHVRLFEEASNGAFPPSRHAPTCEDYKLVRFQRFILEGTRLIDTPANVKALAKSFDDAFDGEYEIEDVYLTQDQFDSMPEFQGF